ncbi:MAG: hypothetical protein U9Q73_00470 [Nanoarchaeota archaeon]|nr:hypothetical protein [Nanoarchaeota archaeon]
MANKRKGNIIRGYKSKSKNYKKRCDFGVNKNTGKCLKHPRKKK